MVHVDLLQRESDEFRDAQARGVEHLEHGAVAQPERLFERRRRQQALDVALGQGLRQGAPKARHGDFCRRIIDAQALAHLMAKKPPKGRQLPSGGLRPRTARRALTEVGQYVRASGVVKTPTLTVQPLLQGFKVCAIRREGVRGEAAFHPGDIEKTQD